MLHKAVKDKQKTLNKLQQEIKEKKKENAALDQQLRELQVCILERREIEEIAGKLCQPWCIRGTEYRTLFHCCQTRYMNTPHNDMCVQHTPHKDVCVYVYSIQRCVRVCVCVQHIPHKDVCVYVYNMQRCCVYVVVTPPCIHCGPQSNW